MEFINWAMYTQIISFFVFFVALNTINIRDNSGNIHFIGKVFKELTSHGEAYVLFIPAFCWLFLELCEKKKKQDETFTFLFSFFLITFFGVSSGYMIVVSRMLEYSVFFDVVLPLVLLNLTAIFVKFIPSEENIARKQ